MNPPPEWRAAMRAHRQCAHAFAAGSASALASVLALIAGGPHWLSGAALALAFGLAIFGHVLKRRAAKLTKIATAALAAMGAR